MALNLVNKRESIKINDKVSELTSSQKHEGGCACGQVRYVVTGEPELAAVCHCEYCQQRTGSAFGVLVYFKTENVEKLSGDLKGYEHQTDFGYRFNTEFCTNCGGTVYWLNNTKAGMTGISGGTFDPPTFWYKIQNEVFCLKKADFVENKIPNKFDELPG